jgi:protein-tyrosine phosphatase
LLPYGLAGKIYRSPMPFSPAFDPDNKVLEAYIGACVDTVVMLTPDEEALAVTGRVLRNVYEQMGLTVIHVPVHDFSIPGLGQFEEAISQTLDAAQSGKTIAVHCHAGIGRTGTFAGCLAKTVFNITGEEAVSWVRQYFPKAVENVEQYQFVIDFTILED